MCDEKENKLFVVNPKKPMKFCVFQGKMLKIKCNQIKKLIKENGGLEIEYDLKDEECIILAEKPTRISDSDVFSIRYIKDCVKKQKILNLEKYRVSSSKSIKKGKTCIDFDSMDIFKNKCKHNTLGEAREELEDIRKFI